MAGLSARQLQVIHTLLRNRRNTAPLNATWQRISEILEVGEPRGNTLYFNDATLRVLRRAAEHASGSENLLAGVPAGARLQAAEQGLIDEKIARQRPDDGFVLVKGALPASLPVLPSGLSLRVPLARLDLAAIAQVLLIENLDSFDDWERYKAPAELAGSLVLYRGHGGLARGARQLLASLPDSVRVSVFPDYDPAGLCIAVGLPCADILLVPVLDDRLLAKGSREHFARQHAQARHLQSTELGGWQSLWAEMKGHEMSIKQQHMLALGSRLRMVSRNPGLKPDA